MYVINPSSGKEIPNSYSTSSSTGSNSSSSSSTGSAGTVTPHHHQHQEIISKILTKCATMTDESAATTATSAAGITTSTTVNGTATILLSPSTHQHHPGVVGVSPQSSPASSSSSASSPTADGPQLQSSFGAASTARDKGKSSAAGSGGTNGSVGGTKHGGHGSSTAGNGGKINGNGALSGPISATNAPGGRLQFFKDGKFILELARAREGEKTSWISVPRKTFWPPTVSSTNANFHKHESSTSLSFSDDNSSVQSSPWQRDHCWKQTNPRSNISKEMSLYYHRPSCVRFKLSRDVWKRLRLKRRRPYEQSIASDIALHYEIIRDRDLPPVDGSTAEADAMEVNGKSSETGSDEDEGKGKAQANGGAGGVVENGTKDFKIRKRRGMLKRNKELGAIVQQLTIRVANSTNCTPRMPPASMRSMLSSSHQQHVSPRKRILRELEKVSLEDSSTMKRSRSKPGSSSTVITATTATPLAAVSSNGTGSSNSSGSSSNSNGKLTNGASAVESRTHSIPTTPVSRPISSYSITSLLGHNSSSESSSSNSSRPKQETNTTTSHHPYQQHQPSSHYQYLGKDVVTSPKSPSDAHLSQRYYGKKKSPSYGSQNAASPNSATEYGAGYGMVRSPDLSPSPEHQGHSFTRYRQHPYSIHPTVSSPSSYSSISRCSPSPNTNDSASSPYSGNAKYRTAYLASGGSPPASTNPATANSPQHYSRQSPLNFARSPPPSHQASYPPSNSLRNNGKEPSSSPRASPSVEPIRVPATTPTSSSSTTPSIRTVPKKTAALRQQFGSPSSSPSTTAADAIRRERSNSNASSTSSEAVRTTHFKKELDYSERSAASDVVDGAHPALSTSQSNPVIRPSTVIASPTPHHPVPNPFYMYPPQIAASLLAAQQSSAVPFLPASHLTSYYQHMYNQAAVAAAYRNPLWMHYQGISPHAAAAAAAAAAAVSPPSAPQPPSSSHTGNNGSSSTRDAHQQRDSNRIHSAAATSAAMTGHNNGIGSSSSSNSNNNNGSSSSPSPAAVALNYSAAALAASSHHPHRPAAAHHHHHSLAAPGPWSVPQHDVSASSVASMASTAKDDPGADVPLNLSKH